MQTQPHIVSTDHIHKIARSFFDSPAFLLYLQTKESQPKQRWGGYLCIIDPTGSMNTHIIGDVPQPKCLHYIRYAQEKARRLKANPELESSWRNRNPAEEQYGGGICAGGYILSFSGLAELTDEALVLAIAARVGLQTEESLRDIAHLSGSHELFHTLLYPELIAVGT